MTKNLKAILQGTFSYKGLLGAVFLAFSASAYAQAPAAAPAYPQVKAYAGIIHPLVTFSSDGPHTNFDESYTVGMPTGINLWKTSKIGFSFEAVPFIRAENGVSKMNNFLFHPGVLAALGNGFTFVGRAAFETSGRYGFTPIINKVIKKNKHSNFFAAVPVPFRFGNDKPSSVTIAFQFGIGF